MIAPFFFAFRELGPARFFSHASKKGAAQEKRGAASRTMPSARGEKTGFTTKNFARVAFHRLMYALLLTAAAVVRDIAVYLKVRNKKR